MTSFKQRLLIGLVFLLPFTVILVILGKALEIAKKITAPLLPHVPHFGFGEGYGFATLIAVLFLFGLCMLASWLAGTGRGKKTEAWLEQYLLQFIPGYTMVRTLLRDAAGRQDEAGVIPVMARIEDAWQWGFITDTLDSGLLAVYVPEVPAMTSGSMYFLTEDRVKRISVPTQQVYKNIRRYGLGARHILQGKL